MILSVRHVRKKFIKIIRFKKILFALNLHMILQNPNILSRIKHIYTLMSIVFAFSLKYHHQKYYSKKLCIMLTQKSHFPLKWYKAPFHGKFECHFMYIPHPSTGTNAIPNTILVLQFPVKIRSTRNSVLENRLPLYWADVHVA